MSFLKKNTNLIFVAFLVILPGLFYVYFNNRNAEYAAITSFEECVRRGYPLSETYPEECMVPGKRFPNPTQKKSEDQSVPEQVVSVKDMFLSETYLFEGQTLKLESGKSTLGNVGTRIEYLPGSETEYDINGDSKQDVLFLLTSERGKDVYSYITALITLNNGVVGLNVLPVGTNISSTTISYSNNKITVRYNSNTSMSLSKELVISDGILTEADKTSN